MAIRGKTAVGHNMAMGRVVRKRGANKAGGKTRPTSGVVWPRMGGKA